MGVRGGGHGGRGYGPVAVPHVSRVAFGDKSCVGIQDASVSTKFALKSFSGPGQDGVAGTLGARHELEAYKVIRSSIGDEVFLKAFVPLQNEGDGVQAINTDLLLRRCSAEPGFTTDWVSGERVACLVYDYGGETLGTIVRAREGLGEDGTPSGELAPAEREAYDRFYDAFLSLDSLFVGLAALHAKGLMHNDVSVHNVVQLPGTLARFIDLGMSDMFNVLCEADEPYFGPTHVPPDYVFEWVYRMRKKGKGFDLEDVLTRCVRESPGWVGLQATLSRLLEWVQLTAKKLRLMESDPERRKYGSYRADERRELHDLCLAVAETIQRRLREDAARALHVYLHWRSKGFGTVDRYRQAIDVYGLGIILLRMFHAGFRHTWAGWDREAARLGKSLYDDIQEHVLLLDLALTMTSWTASDRPSLASARDSYIVTAEIHRLAGPLSETVRTFRSES